MASEKVRAIVIGSGFGGAVAACRLSQAGLDTLILERGRRYESADFPALPTKDLLLPEGRRLGWGPSQGLCDLQDLGELISVQAAGFGGGSLIYANVQLRPPAELMDEVDKEHQRVWPLVHSRAALDPFFDLVAYMLDAAPITEHDAGLRLVKTEQLARVSRSLGREEQFFYPPLAVSRRSGSNEHGQEQEACKQCGACVTGCPHRAKNTLDFNYLAVARKNGAKIRTQCEVIRIERREKVYRVHCIDHLTQEQRHEEAELVFLCAGAVHSTRLLAGADLGLNKDQADHLRRRIGVGYYPNADAVGVIFDCKNPQYPSWGPCITTTTVFPGSRTEPGPHGSPDDDPSRRWFMIQDGGYAQDLDRMIGMMRSPVWAGRNRFLGSHDTATVPASTNEPDAVPTVSGAPALPSILDRVLQARQSGLFANAMPKQLKDAAPGLLDDVSDQLLIPVVKDTIERAARKKTRWVGRLFGENSWPHRLAIRGWVWGAHLLADDEAFGRHAARAALTFGGQSAAQLGVNIGYNADKADHRTMLLAMGPDPSPGVLHYHPSTQSVTADLDLYHQAPRYQDQELAMRDVARALGGELRVNPAWSFLGKPITVHSQGGCRMSEKREFGVTDPDGQVWDCPGLYVMDGACLPASVGANPSSTIAAIAERNVLKLITTRDKTWLEGNSDGAKEYRAQRLKAAEWRANAEAQKWQLEPPKPNTDACLSEPIGLAFEERMQGFHSAPTSRLQSIDIETVKAAFRALETKGRPGHSIDVVLRAQTLNLPRFLEDQKHILTLTGHVNVRLPGSDQVKRYDGKGHLQLLVPRRKPQVLHHEAATVQRKIGRSYTSSKGPPRSTRLMRYTLNFSDEQQQQWELRGYKHVSDDPGADAWRDTTELFVKLSRFTVGRRRELVSAGVMHMDMAGFLKLVQGMCLITPSSNGPMPNPDPARVVWTLVAFCQFFFGSLQRIYMPQLQKMLDTLMRPSWSKHL